MKSAKNLHMSKFTRECSRDDESNRILSFFCQILECWNDRAKIFADLTELQRAISEMKEEVHELHFII